MDEIDYLDIDFDFDTQYIYYEIYQNIIDKKNDLEEIKKIKDIGKFDFNKKFNVDRDNQSLNFSNDSINYCFTYLIIEAVYNNKIEIVKFLLDCGSDINLFEVDVESRTPVMVAIEQNNYEITKLLLEQNDYNINHKDNILHNLIEFTLDLLHELRNTNTQLIIYVCKYVFNKVGKLDEKLKKKSLNKLEKLIESVKEDINLYKMYDKNSVFMKGINMLKLLAKRDENQELKNIIRLKYFLQTYDKFFEEQLFYTYPSSLKKKVLTILLINNKENNEYYLPIEIWLYIFKFIKIIDYY